MTRDPDDPIYGVCDACGSVGYELESCGHCHTMLCGLPGCEHWCEEG